MLPNSVGAMCRTRTYTPPVNSRARCFSHPAAIGCYKFLSFVQFSTLLHFVNCYLYTPNYALF